MKRESGILLPIFSLWGKEQIGTLGAEAFAFVDCLKGAGQKNWQVLPAGPTSYGDSPYQSYSSFAGNPYFIDLYQLKKQGWLDETDLTSQGPSNYIDYAELWNTKLPLLRKAYLRAWGGVEKKVSAFAENFPEIQDYAAFMALKKHFNYAALSLWPEARYKSEFSPSLKAELQNEIDYHLFVQWCFYSQWEALKAYANEKGVRIIGDIPIYVAEDSSDLWANPEFFLLEPDGRLSAVAGVPPDYFSETGQLWGNPLYNWEALQKDNFKWWIRRLEGSLRLYDIIRIDHFRGFEAFWSVPFGDKTAANGTWIKAKGKELFQVLRAKLGDIPAIAEDLGVITPPVKKLIEETGFPGMKVLLFAFYAGQESDYMPHKYKNENCVVYTGTHDNETVAGWFKSGDGADIASACDYLHLSNPLPLDFARAYVKAAWQSKARLSVAPLQDVLGLGNAARINHPSTVGTNWQWRLSAPPPKESLQWLAELTLESKRA